MTARDDWPAPKDVPNWWDALEFLTPERIEQMREEYEREQIATARSEQAMADNQQEHAK